MRLIKRHKFTNQQIMLFRLKDQKYETGLAFTNFSDDDDNDVDAFDDDSLLHDGRRHLDSLLQEEEVHL